MVITIIFDMLLQSWNWVLPKKRGEMY